MRIQIKKGIFSLLSLEAIIIILISVFVIFSLYNIYMDLLYKKSLEVLHLHSRIIEARMSGLDNLTYEILSNRDIQNSIKRYMQAEDKYQRHNARNVLYTQLFSRFAMNDSVVSIQFVFPDESSVHVGNVNEMLSSGKLFREILTQAHSLQGSTGWQIKGSESNSILLFRLVRDISGNEMFRTLGVLIIHVRSSALISHVPNSTTGFNPNIILIDNDKVQSTDKISMSSEEISKLISSETDYSISSVSGLSFFASSTQLKRTGWHLVYLIPTVELFGNITRMNIVYSIILLFTILIVITIGYFFAKSISMPVTRLTNAMRKVRGGDYSYISDKTKINAIAILEIEELDIGFAKMISQIDHLIREDYSKQLTIAEMKYKALQQQINPHFLYNTLDTIYWKAVQSGNKDIEIMITSLSKLFRGSIKGADIITIKEDVDFVEDYLRIQKIRFEDRILFQLDIADFLGHYKIPRLTLQPIVENCIKHNLEKYSQSLLIKMYAYVDANVICLVIEDNGVGMDTTHFDRILSGEAQSGSLSIGLKNINERLKVAFGNEYGISAENIVGQGTRIIVKIPQGGQ